MKRIIITCTVCLSCLLLGGVITTHGQIYKWVDAEGRVHYSDTPIDEAENIDEELPPASRFIAPPRPPSTSSESSESSEEEQSQQEASVDPQESSVGPATNPAADPAEASTNDEAPPQGQQEEDVIGMGEHGPFGPDGPDAPVQNSE